MRDYNHHQHHSINNDQSGSSKYSQPKWGRFTFWVVGLGALLWVLLRSGFKPRRLAYPCQQTALATGLGFLAYLAALTGSATLLRRLKKVFSLGGLALLGVSLTVTALLQGSATDPAQPVLASPALTTRISASAVSTVSAVINVPQPLYSLDGGTIPGSAPSAAAALHDDGVDALVNLMESKGDYFYKTTAHPGGLFAADDVVVIKVNNQWSDRNSTNTDVVKGVIYRLVTRPDGNNFTGAVIVAENAQGQNNDWYNEANSHNNSQFRNQSYQEVVQAFDGLDPNYHVCISDWNAIRANFVSDYDAGNSTNGYVLDTSDNKLSYPKFQVDCHGLSLSVSMKNGLWNGSTFDKTRLKMINLPVLKRHGSQAATIAVKNYLGFITISDLSRFPGDLHCWLTGAGSGCTYGLIGRQMAIRRADLDIVDAIWVNTCSNDGDTGDTADTGESRRQDVLLASRDPFAVDYYASDFVLGPLVQQYSSTCWRIPDYRQSEASYSGGTFRTIQMRNVAQLRTEGITNTINMGLTYDQELAQFSVYVADASASPSPTLTLTSPNGGQSWTIGTQQQIQWTSANLTGNVKLEYSTNNFSTAQTIVADTTNDGAYTWTIPNVPTTTARVRVSSVVSSTLNDTSDANFTIGGPHPFEDSFKVVSQAILEGGEVVTYTIVLYEQTQAPLTLTDTIPSPLSYQASSVHVEPTWKSPAQYTGGDIRWSGTVTATQPVTITFRAQVPVTTTTWSIFNRVQMSRNNSAPIERSVGSFLNGVSLYLPIVSKNF